MAQTTQEFLKSHIPLIDFLAELLGKNSEIVLHDLTNLDSSIIAIRNNYITKRDIGAPATDYVLRTLKTGINENLDFNVGYREISNRDHKQLHSASYYLRKEALIISNFYLEHIANKSRTNNRSYLKHSQDLLRKWQRTLYLMFQSLKEFLLINSNKKIS